MSDIYRSLAEETRETPPPDGYGPGYIVASLAREFHALALIVGFENARRELAEIVNYEAGGRHDA